MKKALAVVVVGIFSFLALACGGGGKSSCTLAAGCGASEYCTLDMTLEDLAAGRIVYACKAKAKLNQKCEFASDRDVNTCEDGAFCGQAAIRSEFTCLATVPPGGECAATYTGPFVCQGGGVCADAGGGKRTCQSVGKEGDACQGTGDCQVGLFCDHDTAKCKARIASGGTCQPDTAMCAGSGPVSQRCTFFSLQCAQDLYCRMPTATECGLWLQCEDFKRCCVTGSGTQCLDIEPPGTCEEPLGTCGP